MSKKRASRKRDVVAARNAFIVDAYSKNVPIKEICAVTGLTYGSVKVIAHRLGCTKKGQDWIDYRRGFSVPTQVADHYNDLVYGLKYKAHEAADLLGIPPLAGAA
jgi:hypothetical protein